MSSSEDEKYDPKKQCKNKIEEQKPVYKYITIEKAMQQIGANSHEMKENEHNKIFALFYNDDNELIEERLTKVVINPLRTDSVKIVKKFSWQLAIYTSCDCERWRA